MLVYATTDDLATWTGTDAPANATSLLRSASLLIADDIKTAIYEADDTGLPTDSDAVEALRDACCAQADSWARLGVDPNLGAAADTKLVTDKQIGTAKIQYAVQGSTIQARADAARSLCPDAERILRAAGLLSYGPIVMG